MSPEHTAALEVKGPDFRRIFLGCGGGCFALLEAFTAKHRTALRWLERDGCFPLAAGADGLGFHSLIIAAVLRQP